VPLTPVRRNRFEVAVGGEDGRRGRRAEIPVRRVTNEGQVVIVNLLQRFDFWFKSTAIVEWPVAI
jgi:hypothetical protein